jgi:hypothetical protein
MFTVIESGDVIEIRYRMRTGLRVILLLLALVPLLAPYELIIRPDWHDYLNIFFLFAALVSAGALMVSLLLAWAAVAGLNSRSRFDRVGRTFTHSSGAPLIRWRTTTCPIDHIERLQVEEHAWSDGSPSFSLVTRLADGRAFKSGSSWSRQEIEDLVRRVSLFLGL